MRVSAEEELEQCARETRIIDDTYANTPPDTPTRTPAAKAARQSSTRRGSELGRIPFLFYQRNTWRSTSLDVALTLRRSLRVGKQPGNLPPVAPVAVARLPRSAESSLELAVETGSVDSS